MKRFDLEEAVQLYGRRMFSYAWALLCDWHEAEDAVQDAFVSAWQHRDGFDGKNVSAWLYKITRNTCLNRLREKKPLSLDDPDVAAPAVEDKYDTGVSPAIIKALGQLDAGDRDIVLSRVMEEQSYSEIASRLGVTEAAARKRYERAKKRLAESLAGESEV